MGLWDKHLRRFTTGFDPDLRLAAINVITDCLIGDIGHAVLVDQPLEDPAASASGDDHHRLRAILNTHGHRHADVIISGLYLVAFEPSRQTACSTPWSTDLHRVASSPTFAYTSTQWTRPPAVTAMLHRSFRGSRALPDHVGESASGIRLLLSSPNCRSAGHRADDRLRTQRALRRRVRAMTSRGVAARSRAEHPAVFGAELGRTVVAQPGGR